MKNRKPFLFVVAAIVLILSTYFIYEHFTYVETDNAQIEAHTVLLAARVPGYIKEVRVSDGARAKKNDVLVQIDDRDYKAILDSSKSELLSLEARKKDTEKNYVRVKELFGSSVVSSQQLDAATANYNEIRAKYDSAAARVVQAELNLEHTQIRAPRDGIVAKNSAEVGQLASAGVPLVGFVGSDERWITANFKETDISKVRVGKEVNIVVDAVAGRNYKGSVESISSATGSSFTLLPPDNATGNFTKVVQRVPVRIKIDELSPEDRDQLQAGLSAVVKVHVR